MQYKKESSVKGAWTRASEIVSGTKCKLVSEVREIESQFQDKNGKTKMQNVGKVKFDGIEEPLNTSLNRVTIAGLVDAFGEESMEWQGHELTAITEKILIAGKKQTMLTLVPKGYKLEEDENGFSHVVKEDFLETIKAD